MKRIALLTVVAAGLFTIPALATHTEPSKGKKVQFALVNGFRECGSPNTATQSNSTPACAPPVESGDPCAFLPGGSGTLVLSRVGRTTNGSQDLKVKAKAIGLNTFCEGLPLYVRLSYRLTTDDCPEGSCTTVDVNDLDLNGAMCIVSNGKCVINTTLNSAAPGLIATNGKNAGLVILGCGLKAPLFIADPADLQCGALLK